MSSLPRLSSSALRIALIMLTFTVLHTALAVPVDGNTPLDPASVPNARVIVVAILGFLTFIGINAAIFVAARRRKLAARALIRSVARPLAAAAAAATIRSPNAVAYYHGRGFVASATRPAPSASASGEQTRDIRDVQFVLDERVSTELLAEADTAVSLLR